MGGHRPHPPLVCYGLWRGSTQQTLCPCPRREYCAIACAPTSVCGLTSAYAPTSAYVPMSAYAPTSACARRCGAPRAMMAPRLHGVKKTSPRSDVAALSSNCRYSSPKAFRSSYLSLEKVELAGDTLRTRHHDRGATVRVVFRVYASCECRLSRRASSHSFIDHSERGPSSLSISCLRLAITRYHERV